MYLGQQFSLKEKGQKSGNDKNQDWMETVSQTQSHHERRDTYMFEKKGLQSIYNSNNHIRGRNIDPYYKTGEETGGSTVQHGTKHVRYYIQRQEDKQMGEGVNKNSLHLENS